MDIPYIGTLARMGFTAQVVKTALASGVSWWIVVLLFGHERPYFATLAAILTVQVTVADSVSRGGQRLVGVLGGIVLSMLAVHILGQTPLTIGLLVLIGMAVTTAFGFGSMAVSQVAISALLVLSLGGKPAYAAERLVDTAIGAVIAILINAFVVPTDVTPVAARHLITLGREVSDTLRKLAASIASEHSVAQELTAARSLTQKFEVAHKTLAEAQHSLVYSPLLAKRRARLQRLARGFEEMDRATMQVRGITRSLLRLEHLQASTADLPDVLTNMAHLVERTCVFIAGANDEDRNDIKNLLDRSAKARRLVEKALLTAPTAQPETLREFGSILTDLDKMHDDLSASLSEHMTDRT